MTFMQSLANNPNNANSTAPPDYRRPMTSGSSIYGQPVRDDAGTLNIVDQLKQREMQDFKEKANFMSDLSLKQERMRALYDPNKMQQQNQQNQIQPNQPQHPMSVQADPNAMTGYQKGELGIKQQGMNLESQRLTQQGQMGQQALDIKAAQEKLNQQKSDQVFQRKVAEANAKQVETKGKLDLATKALADKTKSAAEQLELHKTIAENTKVFHELEMERKNLEFERTSGQHQQTIDNLRAQIKQRRNQKVTTELNPDGTKKTVTTQRGDAASTVKVQGKDGKTYEIPGDKVDEWNASHAPEEQADNIGKAPPSALAVDSSGPDPSDDEEGQ